MKTLTLLAAASVLLAGCGSDHQQVASRPPTSATFRKAADAVLPSVVYIQVEIQPPPGMAMAPMQGPGPDLGPGPERGPGPGPGEPLPGLPPGAPIRAAGSGVILRPDGYILTAAHVVRGAEAISVTLHDHRHFDARIVAEDPSTDVAVVRIKAGNLPVARLGNSDELQPGDWVLALGAPLGLQFSVTAGIVSALGRSIGVLDANSLPGATTTPLEHFIQTDAPINPGNSGGPLVDLNGHVIGINTAIATTTGVFAGAGFAVPINLARRTAEQLIRYGEVRRPFLGVALKDASEADARVFHLPAAEGATVVHVEPRGPAAAAGIKMGDVVIRIDTVKVLTASDLQNALAALQPGGTARITLIRYGRQLTLPVKLGMVRSGGVPLAPPPGITDTIGVGFAVTPQAGRLVISGVRPYSAADRAGVRPGQIIYTVNGQDVRSVDQLARVIAESKGLLSLIVDDPRIGRMIINYTLKP